MIRVVLFIDQIALGLYLIMLALGLWQLWQWVQAQTQARTTFYELERDLARQRQADALTWLAILGQLALIVLGVQRVVSPYLQSEQRIQEQIAAGQIAQDGDFVTATPAPPLAGGIDIQPVPPLGDDNTVLLLTPTLTPTPVGTIVPNAPPIEGCNDPRATLQVPANGMRVFQPITVIGTAYTENFALAKIEISGPGTNNTYAVIDDRRQEARTLSPFSQFVPAPYLSGAYRFRLTVFDITDTLVASCMVTIYISEPPLTATPTVRPGANP